MWTAKNRPRYDRKGLRYPSDLTDEEWGYVEPMIPPAKRGGRKREVNVREILVLETLFGLFPFLKKLFADGGYQGPLFQKALARVLPQIVTES